MKRILQVLGGAAAVVVVVLGGAAAVLAANATRPGRPIGVQQVAVADAGRPAVAVTLFYPTETKPGLTWVGSGFADLAAKAPIAPGEHPLVIISHGTGGGPASHLDTALALAEAGYIVAAPVHTGDNFQDPSQVGTPNWMSDRARHVARVSDHLLTRWSGGSQIDPERVGLFGFSAGGTTGLIAVGGAPDLTRVAARCASQPEFVCRLLKPTSLQASIKSPEWVHTPSIKAAVIVAPGLGFAFEPAGLSNVTVPVQLWAGAADDSVPLATNADTVRRLLPSAPEFHLAKGAGHFSFLAPCGATAPLMPRMLCADPKGFDRVKFHKDFNASVVAFFDRTLRGPHEGHVAGSPKASPAERS